MESESWQTALLGELCTLTKGASPTQKTQPGEYPLIVTGPGPLSSSEYQFEGEAVCVPMVSSTGHGHASLKRVHYVNGRFAVANIVTACEVRYPETCSTRFLHLYLQHYKDELIVPRMQGTANVSLSQRELGQVPVRLPSLGDQRRIVDLIATVDTAIAATDSEESAAAGVAAQLRAKAYGHVTGQRTTIGSIADVSIGKQKNSNGSGSYPYLRAANLSGGRLSIDDLSYMPFSEIERQRMAVKTGDVLIVEGGGGYGHSAMWTLQQDEFVGMQNSIIRMRAKAGISNPYYLLHWAKWARESGAFDNSMTSTTIPHLSLGRVKMMEIPSRNIEEQHGIVELIQAASAVTDRAREHGEVCRALRTELLSSLLSGAHRIPDTYDELLGADTMNSGVQ